MGFHSRNLTDSDRLGPFRGEFRQRPSECVAVVSATSNGRSGSCDNAGFDNRLVLYSIDQTRWQWLSWTTDERFG